jgi:hypothetical protein
MVKRRQSQRINLPANFGSEDMPSMPSLPTQYREVPPSRDGRPPGSSSGRTLNLDPRALQDPNLRPEKCRCLKL